MRKVVVITAFISVFLLSLSCSETQSNSLDAGSSPDVNDSRFNYVISAVPRAANEYVPDADTWELEQGNTDFAFDLYRELKSESGNIVFSPYSINTAMAMLYAGARGRTETEIADVFHFTLPRERLHPAFNAVDQELRSRGVPQSPDAEPWFRLNVANALWGPPEDSWNPDYLDILARYYGSGLREIDLAADPEGSRNIINEWVSENTEGRIPDILQPGELISEATILVLTNAIYFKARWEMPFQESNTRDADFHLLDGSTTSVAMMEFTERSMTFERAEGDGWAAVSLPYDLDGRQGNPWFEYGLSMVVIVPDEGGFREFEDTFDREKLDSIIGDFNQGPVHLFMPKFTYRFHTGLKDTLSRMGMGSVFASADLSGMIGGDALFVRDVIHEAFIAVDEKGTEAAAATAIGVDCIGGELLELTIDRPFMFVIRDQATKEILFIGRVLNPVGQ